MAIFELQRRGGAGQTWEPEDPAFEDDEGLPSGPPDSSLSVVVIRGGYAQTDAEGWRYASDPGTLDRKRVGGRHAPRENDIVRRRAWALPGQSAEVEAGMLNISRFRRFSHAIETAINPQKPLFGDGKCESKNDVIVGHCIVTLLGADVPLRAPYMIMSVEGVERKIPVMRKRNAGGFAPVTKATLEFPLTSIPNLVDLQVFVFDDVSVSRQVPLGRAMVPLGPVLFPSAGNALRRLMENRVWRSDEQVYSLNFLAPERSLFRAEEVGSKFQGVVKGIPGTARIGTRSELGSLGSVDVSVRIELAAPPTQSAGLWSQLVCAPWRSPADKDWTAREAEIDLTLKPEDALTKFDLRRLNAHLNRVISCVVLPPLVRVTLSSRTGAAVGTCVWAAMCLLMPSWCWPLYIWASLVLNGLLSVHMRAQSWQLGDTVAPNNYSCRVWEDQVGEREIPYGTTQLLQGLFVVYEVQEVLVVAANSLEKVSSLLNFADPALSVIVYVAAFVAFAIPALMLMLLPSQLLLAGAGIAAIIGGHLIYDETPSLESLVSQIIRELRASKFGVRSLVGLKYEDGKWQRTTPPTTPPKTPQQTPPMSPRTSEELENKPQSIETMLKNFIARIPTELEMAHRYIATRIVAAPPTSRAAIPNTPEGSFVSGTFVTSSFQREKSGPMRETSSPMRE